MWNPPMPQGQRSEGSCFYWTITRYVSRTDPLFVAGYLHLYNAVSKRCSCTFLYPLESANHNYYLRTCALDWKINRKRMAPLMSRLIGSLNSHRLFYDLLTEHLVNVRTLIVTKAFN